MKFLTTTTTITLISLLPFALATDLAQHSTTTSNLSKRGCASRNYGCEKGYCWIKCDASNGRWCWLAYNGGNGDWVTCSADSQCQSTGASCANPERPSGGCSC
jgi:hypothetical protein